MKTSTARRYSRDWMIVALLMLLLAALGILQYHWLARLSHWEEDRLQAVLQAGANQLAAEINSEFDIIFRTFQMNLGGAVPADLASQFARTWQSITEKTGRSPDEFIEAVYWVPPAAARKSHWRVFRAVDSRLMESEGDSIPAPLLAFVQEQRRVPPTPSRRLPLWDVGGDFVIPIAQRLLPGQHSSAESGRDSAWILIVVNRRHLAETVLPALVRRYIGADANLNLASAVINEGSPPRILYRSDPDLGAADLVEYDVAADIFLLRDSFMVIVKEAPASDASGSRATTELESMGPQPTAHSPAGNQDSGPPAETRWRLLIRHPAGSLATAVSRARQRNLAISFGILAVLGASLVMLLVSTRRARNLARLQMEFVSGVSHELRTPLAVITSAGENLADAVVENREGILEYGSLIRREARQLSNMVERIIQFSRLQSGHLHLDLVPTRVAPLVASAVESFRLEIDENDIASEEEIDPDLPLVLADADALRSALRNLISNAIKYGGRGRWLRVAVGLATSGRDETVRISVQDRGGGIPAQEQSRIFQPFYRTRAAREAQVKGSGLGLSLAAEIVSAHGGRLSVQSKLGEGSCFNLELPIWGEET
jgi:two-component system sensor histidine kinase SenX3